MKGGKAQDMSTVPLRIFHILQAEVSCASYKDQYLSRNGFHIFDKGARTPPSRHLNRLPRHDFNVPWLEAPEIPLLTIKCFAISKVPGKDKSSPFNSTSKVSGPMKASTVRVELDDCVSAKQGHGTLGWLAVQLRRYNSAKLETVK